MSGSRVILKHVTMFELSGHINKRKSARFLQNSTFMLVHVSICCYLRKPQTRKAPNNNVAGTEYPGPRSSLYVLCQGFCETNITLTFMKKPHSYTEPQLSLSIEANYSLRTAIKVSWENHSWEIVNEKNSSTAKARNKLKREFRLVIGLKYSPLNAY